MSERLPLPHGLQLLADAAGVEAALKIALARGGSRLSIPQKAEGSLLEELVGIDAARAIVNDLADVRIEIPLGKRELSRWLKAKGFSQEERAVKLKSARRTIQYWDADSMPSLQSDLFQP